ncbi:MAG: DUF2312 domain-containing protein [Rhizobiaceae bacterium]|nr:DUF2312 domain-containing protein [Rhizobiaceae bacterium]
MSASDGERRKREPAKEEQVANVARDQLRAFVERVERLEEEKREISGFIKDVYGEAKAMGFDTKAIRRIVAIRKKSEDEWREEESILDSYLAALGMLGGE